MNDFTKAADIEAETPITVAADPIAEIAALRAENLQLRSDNAAMQGELNFCRAFADAINKHHANHEAVYRAIGDALGELENKRQGIRGSNREDGT